MERIRNQIKRPKQRFRFTLAKEIEFLNEIQNNLEIKTKL